VFSSGPHEVWSQRRCRAHEHRRTHRDVEQRPDDRSVHRKHRAAKRRTRTSPSMSGTTTLSTRPPRSFASFPSVSLVSVSREQGFAHGVNRLAERSGEDLIVLLNPDAELCDGSLAALAETAESRGAAVVGGCLASPDGEVQLASARALPHRRDTRSLAPHPAHSGVGNAGPPSGSGTPYRVRSC